ncbi:MAG: alpha/beta hydrolase, partial [Schlesneria sp.]
SSSGITIKVANLFRHATIAELAGSLSESKQAAEVSNHAQYLESIRSGKGNTHLVIVGAKLRVPLEMLSPEVHVWWLKLDGLHVWPPKHLDLLTQATIHAHELSDAIPSGKLLLCGHSYGGLLAIEIDRQLALAGQYDVKLILLEPSIPPKRNESMIERAAQKVVDYKKRFRLQLIQELAQGLHKKTIGRIRRVMISARQSVDQKIGIDDRWRFMEPFLIDQIRTYQLPKSIDHDVHLIKTDFYQTDCLVALNQITKGSFSVYTASEDMDHLDLAEARHSMLWLRIVQQLTAEITVL